MHPRALEANPTARSAQRDDDRIHALVRDQYVGATTQDAQRQSDATRPKQQRVERSEIVGGGEVAGRSANAHVRVTSERDSLVQLNAG